MARMTVWGWINVETHVLQHVGFDAESDYGPTFRRILLQQDVVVDILTGKIKLSEYRINDNAQCNSAMSNSMSDEPLITSQISKTYNIKFYGHSALKGLTRYDPNRVNNQPHPSGVKTFRDIIDERYGITDNDDQSLATGIICCSEERILYFLKKYKSPDLAIIFHAGPNFVFNPSFNRDFVWNKTEDVYDRRKEPGWIYYEGMHKDRLPSTQTDGCFEVDTNRMSSVTGQYEHYFASTDINNNRFMGALIQIDQYLAAKNIPAIHVPISHCVPSWFKFTSGPVLLDIMDKAHDPNVWKTSYGASTNAISAEGNMIIADTLSEHIDGMFNIREHE